MNLFGYENGNAALLSLREVSIAGDSAALKELATFINHCAEAMENDQKGLWEHEHLSDFIRRGAPMAKQCCDIVIVHPRLLDTAT